MVIVNKVMHIKNVELIAADAFHEMHFLSNVKIVKGIERAHGGFKMSTAVVILSRQSGLDEGQPKSCFGRPTCLYSLLNNK